MMTWLVRRFIVWSLRNIRELPDDMRDGQMFVLTDADDDFIYVVIP